LGAPQEEQNRPEPTAPQAAQVAAIGDVMGGIRIGVRGDT
jgi:hypothetical protein